MRTDELDISLDHWEGGERTMPIDRTQAIEYIEHPLAGVAPPPNGQTRQPGEPPTWAILCIAVGGIALVFCAVVLVALL